MLFATRRAEAAPVAVILMCLAAALLWSCSGGSSSGGSSPRTLSITTTSVPAGSIRMPYSTTLAATGGTAPYTWSLTGGTLPAGLSLNAASGVISGIPTASASAAALTFTVTDSGSPAQSSTANLSLTIPAVLSITTTSLPKGRVGSAYSATLAATGGTAPYTWSLTGGTLPAGLSLNAASGVISGTPTASASGMALTFKVTDSGSPAQRSTASLSLTIPAIAPVLSITTNSLPNGQVGSAYSATLAATGGTTPYTWSLSAGSLPAGLALKASTGVISGTPTATVASTPLTFTVTDSGSPVQTKSVTLAMTIMGSGITVAISPARAGLTVTQALSLSAATNDNAGVTWSVSPAGGGSFNPATSLNGANVTFTAPSTAGVYTLTATSGTDTTRSASVTVGVTDLPGVYTYHNDLARDGANTSEYALTPANVNKATFGKLFSCTVDGAVYAQPLWVANLGVAGAMRNVVFVATAHDGLYAFDADTNTSPCTPLWKVSLIDTAHGANSGETTVPNGTQGYLVGLGFGDMTPEVGVVGTPVIDPAGGILYVVSKSVSAGGTSFYQRLHAIDLTTGNEKAGSPVDIAASYPGTGDGGTIVRFSAREENQRAGLALVNGTVYIAWGSHEDGPPYYGWVAAYTYDGTAFTQSSALNVTPNTRQGGIWMSGGAPSADGNGNLYVITSNGHFDVTNGGPDYGDCFLQLKLNSALVVSSWFSPSDQLNDDVSNNDFGSGGSAIVLPLQHLVVGGGKDGMLYLLNGDNMGGSGDLRARQHFSVPGSPPSNEIFATAAFWNNTLYLAPFGGSMLAYAFDTSTDMFNTTATSQSPTTYGFAGSSPSVSASGASSNGILWGLDSGSFCTNQATSCGPAVLHAYNATNLASELWNSSMVGADAAGNAVKFTVPTVANGKVYVGTRGNNLGGVFGSTTISGELDVYGLKPN